MKLVQRVAVSLLLFAAGCTAARGNDEDFPVEIHGRAAALLFVGIDCPISNGYAPQLKRIISDYSGRGIDFYLVYPDATITLDAAKNHAADYGYSCPVLIDPRRQLVKKWGVTVTPEAAVVSSRGELLYLGRIDDSYAALGRKRFAVTTNNLRDALDAIVAGRPVAVARTTAVGCSID